MLRELRAGDARAAPHLVVCDTIELIDPRTLTAAPSPRDLDRYLRPEPFIESDAPEIRAEALRAEGCNVVDKTETSEQGKFGWVIDPEGNKVELWQPPAGQ